MFSNIIHGSIRKKLTMLIILAILPVFAVLLFNEFTERNDKIRAAENDALALLNSFSEVQRRITDSTRTLLRTVSELPEIKNGNPEASRRILATLLRANPIYTNCILIDEQGDVIAMGKGKNRGFNFADRKQLKDAVRTRDFSYGEFVIGKATKKSIFPFAMPVLDDLGIPQGAIIIGVDLSHYGNLFEKSSFPVGSFFGICDHRGTRVFRYPMTPKLSTGLPIKRTVFDKVETTKGAGTMTMMDSSGVERIYVFDPLRLTDEGHPYMYMFIGLDQARVFKAANRQLIWGGVMSVLSLCFALSMAWLLGWRSIAERIDRLALAAQRLGKGERDVRSEMDYRDGEIGQLAESFDTMSKLLRNREKDLEAARVTAETANKAKDEFLANISHEVRTPLNGVMGMLQLMQETKVDDEQKSFLSTALHSSRSLLRVLNDLLDFIRVGVGKMELVEESFDLKGLVDQSVNLFQLQLEEKDLVLTSHIHPGVEGQYMGDAGRIRQVIFNLLGNAIKFTPAGSIHLSVFSLPHPKTGKDRLFFSIEDTGVGIPDNKVDYVFDAFTQVDGSLSREHKGTGLGLPIVKKLVSLMGGNCVVESEVNVGTTVLFCVEVARVRDGDILCENAKRSRADFSLRILLVEDERVNSMMAKRLLEKMGHNVTCAYNGVECLDLLRSHPFDIILMDIQMPGMNGLEATKIIRSDKMYRPYADIPIIALSAHAAEQDQKQACEAGVNAYVTKPFEWEVLENTLMASVFPGRDKSG